VPDERRLISLFIAYTGSGRGVLRSYCIEPETIDLFGLGHNLSFLWLG